MTSEAHLARVSLCFDSRYTVDCETSEEHFSDASSEASEDSFHLANEEFFLPYDVRTDVRRFQFTSL